MLSFRRSFCSTSSALRHRALVYAGKGEPSDILRAVTFPPLPPAPAHTINVRILASPVNPSDVNVIQGVYPTRPNPAPEIIQASSDADVPVFVGGNECIAEVVSLGEGAEGLNAGDWVLVAKPQPGTWRSTLNVGTNDVIRVPRHEHLSALHASTLTVNPPTAWNMLHDYVQLSPGDYVLQNGANSAVGQNVVQMARHLGLRTINFVRSRDNFDSLKDELSALRADYVFTYDELTDKSVSSRIKELTKDKPIKLFLNCVGGCDTTAMAKLVGPDAHLVTYGAMSKQPLSLPASLFIFKNLTTHGFWQNQWYQTHSRSEREQLVARLTSLISEKKLASPDVELVTLAGHKSDAELTDEVRGLMKKMSDGFNKKIILHIEDVA